jgi:hypothetical protein
MLPEFHYENALKFLPFAWAYVAFVSLIFLKLNQKQTALLFFLSFHICLFAGYAANEILFSPSYFPDQWNYYASARQLVGYFLDSGPFSKYGPTVWIQSLVFLPFYIIFGPSLFLGQIVNSIFTAHLVALVFNWLSPKLNGKYFLFSLLLLGYPSFYNWCSLNYREALIMLLTGFLIINLEKNRLFSCSFALFVLFLIKLQVVVFLLLGYSFGHLYKHKAGPRIIVPLFFSVLSFFTLINSGYFNTKWFDFNYLITMKESFESQGGGSAMPAEKDEFGEFVLTPQSLALGWFRGNFMPLLGQGTQLSILLNSIENTILLAIFLLFSIKAGWKKILAEYPLLFFYFVLFSFVNTFVVSNLGTLARYKLPYMYFIVCVMVVHLINKEQNYPDIGGGKVI